MQRRYLDLHRIRSNSSQVIGHQPGNLFMVLMRDKAARYFGVGFRRQNRLRPFARIAAPNAAHVERRAATVSLQGAVAFLAGQSLDANGLLIFLLVKRNAGNHLAFNLRHFLHIVIKTGHGDTSVRIRHLGQHLAKHVNGIGHCAAEVPGVQVAVRSGYFHLPISQTAQAGGQRRQIGSQHAGVRHEDNVGLQQLFVLLAEGFQAGRTNLFLALEDEFHVDLQQAALRQVFKGFDLDEGLSLVIVGTARPDTPVAHFRLEGGAFP